MGDIEIYEYRRLDLRDSYVLDGFPSVGLVSTIAASYIVAALDMELIGVMDSVYFPTVSVVREGEPHHPVRFYAGDLEGPEGDWTRLVVFLSEFQPPSNLIKMICNTVLDWTEEQKCTCLLSPEGLVIEGENVSPSKSEKNVDSEENDDDGTAEGKNGDADAEKDQITQIDVEVPPGSLDEKLVYGISSTTSGRERMNASSIPVFPEGLISGIPGVFLNEGKKRNFEVTCLLAEARDNIPDARAAATIIEKLKEIIPYFEIDLAPLYAEADLLEAKMRGFQKVAKPGGKSSAPLPSMYG